LLLLLLFAFFHSLSYVFNDYLSDISLIDFINRVLFGAVGKYKIFMRRVWKVLAGFGWEFEEIWKTEKVEIIVFEVTGPNEI
jgi:hypothetical protein